MGNIDYERESCLNSRAQGGWFWNLMRNLLEARNAGTKRKPMLQGEVPSSGSKVVR